MTTVRKTAQKTAENRNPGDPDARTFVERTIRVDQAGEFGAVRIYEGQLAALRWTGRGRGEASRKIAAMAQAERKHSKEFDRLLVARRVRPTLLSPLWSVAGFALGAATALMGEKAAMACTVAVEETIDEHYAGQAAALGDDEALEVQRDADPIGGGRAEVAVHHGAVMLVLRSCARHGRVGSKRLSRPRQQSA